MTPDHKKALEEFPKMLTKEALVCWYANHSRTLYKALQIAAINGEMLEALKLVRDRASEEYDYQMGNVGAECALRHIIEKSEAAVASKMKGDGDV